MRVTKLAVVVCLGLALLAVGNTYGQSNTYTSTGSMTTKRYGHVATKLIGGTVLMTGGCASSGSCLASSEIYTPSTGSFNVAGNMQSKRWGHTATLLPSGQVLITGGCTGSGSCQASAELFNPATGGFTLTTGAMNYHRYDHTATLLHDGTVLLAGGCTDNDICYATAEIYNPATQTFATVGSMESARNLHKATLLNNGMVLITGGCIDGGDNNCLLTAELYNPATKTFSSTGSMSTKRFEQTAVLLYTGNVLISGGCPGSGGCDSSTELYNPTTGTFSLSGPMSIGRYGGTSNLLEDGTVLTSGGCAKPNNCEMTAELYTPSTGKYALTGSMTEKRYSQTSTLLDSGQVLTTGGCSGGGTCYSTSQLYNPPPPVTGFINPKFVIIGVIYSPPGSQSTVTYSNNTVFGNSTTLTSSFMNMIGQSTMVGEVLGFNMPNPIAGTSTQLTNNNATSFTQEQDSSSSVAVSQTMSESTALHGFSGVAGIDHSYDEVFVWLNPILYYSVYPENPSSLTWNGYSFDMNDTNTMDVVGVEIGWLTGARPYEANVKTALQRGWNTSQTWPAGQGPALSTADLATLLASDPFSNSSYTLSFPAGSLTTTDGRFTATPNPTVDYEPNVTSGYSDVYTVTQTQSQTAKYSYQIMFGTEAQFKGTTFLDTFSADLKESSTLTWTNQFSQATNNSQSQSATLSVTGPAEGSGYTGPSRFTVYQDNVYGTFLFFPNSD